ncbi:MAG: iron-containing alcohol dehydrogenase, partial [Bacteroidales bacterium]|nr:iron-containing alcohol dehydrogenase [Bacteroidales bacterium]
MVKPFNFTRLPEIFFGEGKLSLLPDLVCKFGKRIILVTGRRSFMDSASAAMVLDSFNRAGISFIRIEISGEPSPDDVDSAVQLTSDGQVDSVVAIGGGSVMDAGKAISAMYGFSDSVIQFLEGVGTKQHPGSKLPFAAVPTTSGTGSEATSNAVISRVGRDGFKKSLRHANFVPDIALVDPALTVSCSPEITAASGMDCFTQLTEAFLSDRANEFTDALALEGLKALSNSLTKAYHNGADIPARSGMSFAALVSGICLANAGLGVVHGFASSVGSMFDIPHGVVCGTLMAPANRIIVRELRSGKGLTDTLTKYAALGKIFIPAEGKTDD